MKFTSIKQTRFNTAKTTLTLIRTLIGFTVFLTILSLGSCGVANDADPSSDPPSPPPDYISFTLTNSNGAEIDLTTLLSSGNTYGLVITPTSGTSGTTIPTADYIITHTPATAITTNVVRTNSVDFTVNNTADTTVTFTVTHRTNSAASETITLNLVDYMSIALTNFGGTVDPSTPLSRGNTYGIVVTPGSGVMPATADYIISYLPTTAITINATRANSFDFTVNNTADTTVTITVIHRTNSAVRKSFTLNFADYMNFALTSGSVGISTTSALHYGNRYLLTITPASDASINTADYVIGFNPASLVIVDSTSPNSVNFRIGNSGTTLSVIVIHRTDSTIRRTLRFNLINPNIPTTDFARDIQGDVPTLAAANALTREVLEPLGVNAGAILEKRYMTENGAGSGDGSSWANAWVGTSLRNNINAINNAGIGRVYLVMVAGGTYKPGSSRSESFSMKDRVAIMGGFQTGGGWERTGTTIFSGDIGTVGSANDNSYHVFNNSGVNNAHLYGVIITGGNANGSGAGQDGGGMYNNNSSPVLTEVVFSGNAATDEGGGMFNSGSSPVLTRVGFSGNTTTGTFAEGGGMFNDTSSPILARVLFSGNTASRSGGGMHNINSSPALTSVVFTGNRAPSGGGMYNTRGSSPVLIGAVFRNNSAGTGGAMANDNGGAPGPLIVNGLFFGNTLLPGSTSTAPDIGLDLGGAGNEHIRIAGSVLGIGQGQVRGGVVSYGTGTSLVFSYHLVNNLAQNFGADATFTINGINFLYPTITSGTAVNLGLHVRRSGTAYYFSEDESTWYSGLSTTGGLITVDTPPANAENLTATDIAGNPRNARPDAGVYEMQ